MKSVDILKNVLTFDLSIARSKRVTKNDKKMETLKMKIAQILVYIVLTGVLAAIVAFAFRNGVSDLA